MDERQTDNITSLDDLWDETLHMVWEFHEAFKIEGQTFMDPTFPSHKVQLMRVQALIEEVAELAHDIGRENMTGILDALCDIQYFLDGTFLAFGLADHKMPGMREVHRSNMTKLGEDGQPIRDKSGRVVKGPNYEPPDLERVLREH